MTNTLSLKHLKGDLTGGVVAAIVALPLALAFGVASGLGAQAGLYGAIACGIFAGLFGGTPGQVSGPTGPMTVVVASMIAAHTGQPELIFAAILLGGLLQIAMGALKMGGLIRYIPYPVISGFMTGIGIIIIAVEIPPLFGLPTPSNAVEGIKAIADIPSGLNPLAIVIGLVTILIIYLLPRLLRGIPPALVALFGCTLATVYLGLEIPQIRDIGAIPAGMPAPHIPLVSWANLTVIFSAGLSLAVLGAIDSLLTSVVVDKVTFQHHNSNRELIGQGIGNFVSGLFGGLPGAGATMRSIVNVQSGGKTQLSGVIHGVLLLGVLLGLGSLVSTIPLACLAGILITVGISIMDKRGLKSIGRAPSGDILVMIIVLLLTVFLDLITAVLVGLSIATFIFCKRFADLESSEHGHLESLQEFYDTIQRIPPEDLKRIYSYTFVGPLFFGEVSNFNRVLSQLSDIKILILNLENVNLVDQTGVFALDDTIKLLNQRGIRLLFTGLHHHLDPLLTKMNVSRHILPENRFDTLEDALEQIAASYTAT
jgi:sulfate permease, SulP family